MSAGHGIPSWILGIAVPVVLAGVPGAAALWSTVESMQTLASEVEKLGAKAQDVETRLRLSEQTLAQLDGLITPQGIAEYTAAMALIQHRLKELEQQ
jgi:hypothetical protein